LRLDGKTHALAGFDRKRIRRVNHKRAVGSTGHGQS